MLSSPTVTFGKESSKKVKQLWLQLRQTGNDNDECC